MKFFCEDVLRWLADVGQLRCLAQLAPAALGGGNFLFPDQIKLRVRFSLDNMKLDDDVQDVSGVPRSNKQIHPDRLHTPCRCTVVYGQASQLLKLFPGQDLPLPDCS